MAADLKIKYEGGDADNHFVEMRAFGNSMLGFERIISDGLIFLGEDRLPRRGERHTLVVRAHEPVIGSSEIPIYLTQAAGLLPFGCLAYANRCSRGGKSFCEIRVYPFER